MAQSTGRRTGRPKAGEKVLTRGGILEAALRLADEEGMGALSMRRLGRVLEVDPMAVYHHVPNKDALISGVVEQVFSEMRVPKAEGRPWQERVRGFARAYRNLALAHPHLIRELVSGSAAPATLRAGEPLYAALEAGGFPPQTVVRAADLVVDYVNGFALAEVGGPLGSPEDRRGLLRLLEECPEGSVQAMRRVFGALSEEEMPADFEFGLGMLISGLENAVQEKPRGTLS